jgi:hypothetical protein
MPQDNTLIISHNSGTILIMPGVTPLEKILAIAGGVLENLGDGDLCVNFDFGISIAFTNEVADTVFLYINPEDARAKFVGRINILPDGFFDNPNPVAFESHLHRNKFERFWKAYPFSIYMVRPGLRVGYCARPDTAFVLVDDGSRLPAKPK